MLKSLEINGFKSFAKKTLLNFGVQITAIVGPNGSGKSNVAESFRFVLGEQSIKSMRGKKGEDLIWNGSSESPRANRSNVKIIFDNTSKKLTENKRNFSIDFDEVIIERVVNRDGENEYYINGTKVRYKDIIELLAQAHIGASGHQIISQGEADGLLRANNQEKKEIIEDALGLKIYMYKRQESEKKFAQTKSNIKEIEILRKEIAPHLKFLKKQVEKYERSKELKEQMLNLYKEYLKREKVYIDTTKSLISSDKNKLKERLSILENLLKDAEVLVGNYERNSEKEKEIDNLNFSLEKERKEKDFLERELGQIEGEINSNTKSIEKTLEVAKSQEGRRVKLKDFEDFAQEIYLLTDLQLIFDKIKNFINSFKDKLDTTLVEEIRKINVSLISKKLDLENELKQKENNINEMGQRIKDLHQFINKEKESSRVAERTIFNIKTEQNQIRSQIILFEEKEKTLKIEEEDFLMQLKEGGVILGHLVLGFENHEISPLTEERDLQIQRRKELERIKIKYEEIGGVAGEEAMKEYTETNDRDQFLAKELDDLYKSANSLEILIKELEIKLSDEFTKGVEKINKSFDEFFGLMFDGGAASLNITNEKKDTDFETEETQKEKIGIEISINLPKKRIKSLEMLSGGERALTSIALLFAIASVNPPPFIILDETDAALDESNSKKYGDMIEMLAKHSQLILITHNRETMSRASVIYGITMGKDGASKMLSIAFDEAVRVAK